MAENTIQERGLNTTHRPKNADKGQTMSEQDLDEVAPKIRVSLDISPELYAKLQSLARDIRKSLALMDVAVQARKSGKKIGIADRAEQLTTEIIGFEY